MTFPYLSQLYLDLLQVDVVFAFKGNNAKSFGSTFPHKKSTHRTTRAFELSVIGRQPGEKAVSDFVEVYISIIQVGAGVDFELLINSLTFECQNPQLPENQKRRSSWEKRPDEVLQAM